MLKKTPKYNFPIPRSLVGRAVAGLMFGSLLTCVVVSVFLDFIYALMAIFSKLALADISCFVFSKAAKSVNFFDSLLSGGVMIFADFLFSTLFIAGIWLFGYVVMRYTKAGDATATRYFKLSIFATVAVFLLPTIFAIRGFEANAFYSIWTIFCAFCKLCVYLYLSYFFFMKIPFGSNSTWARGFSPRKYFSRLGKWILSFGKLKLFSFLALFIALFLGQYAILLCVL